MSASAPAASPWAIAPETSRSETRPPAKGGPVLMSDCITPVSGETMLCLLWKRWERDT